MVVIRLVPLGVITVDAPVPQVGSTVMSTPSVSSSRVRERLITPPLEGSRLDDVAHRMVDVSPILKGPLEYLFAM